MMKSKFIYGVAIFILSIGAGCVAPEEKLVKVKVEEASRAFLERNVGATFQIIGTISKNYKSGPRVCAEGGAADSIHLDNFECSNEYENQSVLITGTVVYVPSDVPRAKFAQSDGGDYYTFKVTKCTRMQTTGPRALDTQELKNVGK